MSEHGSRRSRAGATQAVALLLMIQIPIVPITSLAPNLPQIMRYFGAVPNHDFLVPLIMTLPSLGIVLLGPVAGMLADRFSRRRLLLGALMLFGSAGVVLLFLQDLYAILAVHAAIGIGSAVIMTNANALFGDYFQEPERTQWLGVQSIIGPVFLGCVALAAGYLGTLSWRAPFATDMVAVVIACWLWLTTSEPAAVPKQAVGAHASADPFPWRIMRPIAVVTLISSIIFYVPAVYLGLIYDQLGAHSPALISVLSTAGTIGSVAAGFYFRRFRHTTAVNLALMYGLFAGGLIGLGVSPDYRVGLLFGIVVNGGIGLCLPTLLAWAMQRLPAASRGRGLGLWMSAFFAAQLLSPPLFALLAHGSGGMVHAAILTGLGCLLLSALAAGSTPCGEPGRVRRSAWSGWSAVDPARSRRR